MEIIKQFSIPRGAEGKERKYNNRVMLLICPFQNSCWNLTVFATVLKSGAFRKGLCHESFNSHEFVLYVIAKIN
jgi:hypothetical protein